MSTNRVDGTAQSAETLRTLVESAKVPLAAVQRPSGRFLAVNPALARLLDGTVEALTGTSSLDLLLPGEQDAGRLGFQALADGDLTGYQAIRTLPQAGEPGQALSVWVSVIEMDGARMGLVSVGSAADRDNQFGLLPPLPSIPGRGNVVLGTVDNAWRVDRISQDVLAMFGITPEQCAGQPVLGVIHPADAPAFLAAVEHARRGERAVRLALRLSPDARDWAAVGAVIATLSPGAPPALASPSCATTPTRPPLTTAAAKRGWSSICCGSRRSCGRPD